MEKNDKKDFVVEIISIGEELLIGKIVNTNATWLASRVTKLGGKVRRITVVGDDVYEIISAINEAIKRKPNLIITTGGLGPTFDDKTMEALAKLINKPLKINHEIANIIRERCLRKNLPVNEKRLKMAYVPEGSKVILNRIGLAPGVIITKNNVKIVALPGVPDEMKDLFNRGIAPLICGEKFFEEELIVEDIYEADIASIIDEVMNKIPEVYIKSHPKIEDDKVVLKLHIYSRRSHEVVKNAVKMIIEKICLTKGKIRHCLAG